MPVFRFSKALAAARNVMASLSRESTITRAAPPHTGRRVAELKKEIETSRSELPRMVEEFRAARRGVGKTGWVEHARSVKSKRQEIFRLRNELRAAQGRVEEGSVAGALPDFVIIGAPKCGTTFLYHLLARHPYVEPASFKELNYFDLLFDRGTEWYRQCFPATRQRNGRRTITGEGTPSYLFHPPAAERMAEVVPLARLITLLRNPVDRSYSAYQHVVRNGQETRSFEETVEAYFRTGQRGYLSQGIYVDHLMRWSVFFDKEQMLVLKSEDFFENTHETLKSVLDFLDLPPWEPGPSELGGYRNAGGYEQGMDPALRRRLEDYYEPHNRRLYEYLGVDLGW